MAEKGDLQHPGARCSDSTRGDAWLGCKVRAGTLALPPARRGLGSRGVLRPSRGGRAGAVATLELAHVELALAASVVHVADLPEDGPLCPALVVYAADGPEAACRARGRSVSSPPRSEASGEQVGCGCKAGWAAAWAGLSAESSPPTSATLASREKTPQPHAPLLQLAYISVGVPPVQLVAVVEVDGKPQGLLGGAGPLQDLLGPVHPQEAVHLALPDHLELGGKGESQGSVRASSPLPPGKRLGTLWGRCGVLPGQRSRAGHAWSPAPAPAARREKASCLWRGASGWFAPSRRHL